ncbi:MAG: ATP-binding cassette domain-containing protein [Acidimicrobiia bacterium]|nr:ATP-binding cassette domain-containing protein [Acidimicrobiia bacterium]MYC46477.1 ATP-binding cassette domain-containing protein [Acidimicrobiia bacterium]
MAGVGVAHLRPRAEVLLQVTELEVDFPAGRGQRVSAVSGVSFDVATGETLGLVGESGCGKSSTARAILQLPRPTSGSVAFDGTELTALRGEDLRRVRTGLQMIFQDPIASLNPRRRVADIVREGLDIWPEASEQATERVRTALADVGMDFEEAGNRRPHEFSGGQCQRICIARALALRPRVLICDEPVSSLDVSIQAQILNLLEDLKELYGLTMLFIAHDLAVVKSISDRVCVMYLGRICEIGPTDAIFDRPAHPYTEALLASIPQLDAAAAEAGALRGDPPSPFEAPSGCRFRTRCDRATDLCAEQVPELRPAPSGQFVACHFPLTGEPTPADDPADDAAVGHPTATASP